MRTQLQKLIQCIKSFHRVLAEDRHGNGCIFFLIYWTLLSLIPTSSQVACIDYLMLFISEWSVTHWFQIIYLFCLYNIYLISFACSFCLDVVLSDNAVRRILLTWETYTVWRSNKTKLMMLQTANPNIDFNVNDCCSKPS